MPRTCQWKSTLFSLPVLSLTYRSSDLTASTVLSMRTKGVMFKPLFCLFLQAMYVNKREYLKNYSLNPVHIALRQL